jgi:hypothetical protein
MGQNAIREDLIKPQTEQKIAQSSKNVYQGNVPIQTFVDLPKKEAKKTPKLTEFTDPVQPPKPQTKSRVFELLTRTFPEIDFNINKELGLKYLPYVLFFALWMAILITNHHFGDKTLVEINRARKELNDNKADYYTQNSILSNQAMQSSVVKMIDSFGLGLKELRVPPHKIKVYNK